MSKYKQFEDEKEVKVPVGKKNEKKVSEDLALSHYDGSKIPPDFNICLGHGKAKSVGIEEKDQEEFCPCCQNRIAKKEIGLWDGITNLAFLGPGYPLFFLYIKYCIYILIVLFLLSGLYGIITNASGGDCRTEAELSASVKDKPNPTSLLSDLMTSECLLSYVSQYSLANKRNDGDSMEVQNWLNFVTVIVFIVFLHIFRWRQRVMASICDERDTSASDYTICVENLPRGLAIDYLKELKEFIEGQVIPNQKIEVFKVDLTYDLHELTDLKANIAKVKAENKKAYSQLIDTGKLPNNLTKESLDKKLKTAEDALLEYQDKLSKGSRGEFTGTAFVTFNYEPMKDAVIHHFRHDKTEKSKFHNTKIKVKAAADPSDVYWENLHLTNKERETRKWIGYVLSAALLIACAIGIYELTVYQDSVTEISHSTTGGENTSATALATKKKKIKISISTESVKYVTIAISILIVVINKFLTFVIPIISKFEKNKTRTDSDASTASKLSFVLFINTGFMTFIVTYTFVENYYGNGGLITNIYSVFISMALMNPGLLILNIGYWIGKIKIWFYRRKGDDKVKLYQDEANKLFENPYFPVPTSYAALVNIMWFTCFYLPVLPMGVLWSIFGLICYYWAFKYTLLRRTTVECDLSDNLTENMTDYLEISILIYSASTFMFNWVFDKEHQWSVPCILSVIFGILNFLAPSEDINKKIFKVANQPESKSYADAEDDLDTDYSRENPATKEDAIRDDRERKQKRLNEAKSATSQKKNQSPVPAGNKKK